MKKIKFLIAGITILSIVFSTNINAKETSPILKYSNENIYNNIEKTKPQKKVPLTEDRQEVKIMAVGDNLIHSLVIKAGKNNDGTYDFNYMYKNIVNYISTADLKIINQETVLINDSNKYSGYPTFGSPTQIGEAVVNAGFNIVTQATNHAYDKREEGILDSIDFWEKNNIPVLGIHKDTESYEKVFIKECNGIKIAMLNYTYSLNGFSLPKDKYFLVDLLSNKEKIKKDLLYAEQNADITIVFPHWGTEYSIDETKEQKEMATFLAENGADLIIGAHPHVVEPLKTLEINNKTIPVFYSLGNFISNQNEVPRMLGAIAEIKIVKENNKTYIEEYKMTPVVTNIESYSKRFDVYLLKDYNEELASLHRLRRIKGNAMSLENINKLWNEIISKK